MDRVWKGTADVSCKYESFLEESQRRAGNWCGQNVRIYCAVDHTFGCRVNQIVWMGVESMDDILWTAKGYREFLAAWLAREQERRPSFSIRLVAKKLALDPSLLGKILLGERHLATSRIQPVCDLVGLEGNQAEYFRHLVLHAKSKTAREAQACFERLQELRRIAPLPLADVQESYWDKWIHIALRSLLTCGNFRDDWVAMGELLHPRQSAKMVKTAMATLERLGMVAKDQGGCWRTAEPFVKNAPGTQARALRNFHRQSLLLAMDSLEGLDPSKRNVSSATITVDEAEYQELVAMVADLRSRALTRSAKVERPTKVVQLNLQLVPVAGYGIRDAAGTV